ncbi:MAG: hypothetical protein ACI9CU_000631 [Polaribacter sp.]|jgi:hypothetical protein
MRTLAFTLCLSVFFAPQFLSAQTFEDRRDQYIDSALANPSNHGITVQAYEGVTVDQQTLDDIYAQIQTRSTIDFAIVQLIRVMMLSDEALDIEMIPVLNSVPYWINYSDTTRGYWSENHMIMWMSSDWIMHEYTGRPADATLEQRLKHYLNLKIDYGFYEYFSSTYAPYCLSGLLNLADFSQDQEIKSLAISASKRLMKDLLMVTNDQGVFFPVAGRNYPGKYLSAHGQNHSSLIWLLTGFGPAPSKATHSGGFLASTSIDFSEVTDSWVSELDTVYHIGHTLEEGFVINQDLTPLDRTIFQWSSGSYFHPDVVFETVSLLVDSNMWNHVDFDLLLPLAGFPLESYRGLSEGLSGISKSSLNTQAHIAIFKNDQVTLCSNQDFWKGKVGYQQWPVCANSGTSAVYTASGRVEADWRDRNSNNANEHLPYVEQSHNVALVMYRPEPLTPIIPFYDKEVALYWVDSVYDEIVEDGMWLIGREDEGYVAVRRPCNDYIDGVRACETDGGQAWVIVVGNENIHGNFSNFQAAVTQSQFTETWTINANGDSVYYASIEMDSILIEHYWQPLVNTGIVASVSEKSALPLWPNPAIENVKIGLESFENEVEITVINNLGQTVFSKAVSANQKQFTLPLATWSTGLYSVTISDNENRLTQRLVKE